MKNIIYLLTVILCVAVAIWVNMRDEIKLTPPLSRDGVAMNVSEQEIIDEYIATQRGAKWSITLDEKLSDYDSTEWVFDGEKGTIEITTEGIIVSAGAEVGQNAHNAVLWNRRKLRGDVKVEYDYTRIDSLEWDRGNVNIIYIHAQGKGEAPYSKDIMEWNHLRTIPAMTLYFNNMLTYHISYAAISNGRNGMQRYEYVRGRMYNPTADKGLAGTDLVPEYRETGLFKTGVKYHITVTLAGDKLYMEVEGDSRHELIYFDIDESTRLEDGYLGFRMMAGRSAKYANLKVYESK